MGWSYEKSRASRHKVPWAARRTPCGVLLTSAIGAKLVHESSCPCHNRSQMASVFLLSGVFACFYVWIAIFGESFVRFLVDTRASLSHFVQSVTLFPFGTASKKHQELQKNIKIKFGRPQIFHFCGRPFSLFSPMQFLNRYRQKSLVIPFNILVSFFT